ncbi:hypothetical protein [Micromonospora sp. KC723]|uniref:hypothetical protein n=1 Tax=Micromonospora sp. KC723 TaxID=2530381 RepID=UPI00104E074D|nr:hypothetical protein [Micromonospora sp. KC723]TDB78441.1 hypothetical protein E1165_00025 [Micromonospora sp. KC723]
MTFRTLRRAGVLAACLTTLGAASLVTAGPAQAAVSCSGTVTFSKTVPSSNPVGELVIYYNSSNGGTNSACFYHRGATYGNSALTGVQIARCTQRSGEGRPCDFAAISAPDEGTYAYHAGPVGVTGTANYCVSAKGWIAWGGRVHSVDSLTQGC